MFIVVKRACEKSALPLVSTNYHRQELGRYGLFT